MDNPKGYGPHVGTESECATCLTRAGSREIAVQALIEAARGVTDGDGRLDLLSDMLADLDDIEDAYRESPHPR